MILTAAGKMAFRYKGARIIYAIFTDAENFEVGFYYCRQVLRHANRIPVLLCHISRLTARPKQLKWKRQQRKCYFDQQINKSNPLQVKTKQFCHISADTYIYSSCFKTNNTRVFFYIYAKIHPFSGTGCSLL